MMVELTVLGSGTSSGVPVIGCHCAVCQSPHPKNKRLRSSCLFRVNGKNILVDTGPDLREQCLKNQIEKIDAVLITHIHADHVHGIDELRLFNALQKSSIPIFGETKTLDHLAKIFAYIFQQQKGDYPSLVPSLEPQVIAAGPFDCVGVPVLMIPCQHGERWMTYNYRIGNVAWLTDTSGIPESSYAYLQNLEYLFIDGLRLQQHPTHFSLGQAKAVAERVGARMTYFIHLSHDYDHDMFNKTLPENMRLAHDGLCVKTRL